MLIRINTSPSQHPHAAAGTHDAPPTHLAVNPQLMTTPNAQNCSTHHNSMNLALDLAAKTGGLALHLGAEGRHLVSNLSTPDYGQKVIFDRTATNPLNNLLHTFLS